MDVLHLLFAGISIVAITASVMMIEPMHPSFTTSADERRVAVRFSFFLLLAIVAALAFFIFP